MRLVIAFCLLFTMFSCLSYGGYRIKVLHSSVGGGHGALLANNTKGGRFDQSNFISRVAQKYHVYQPGLQRSRHHLGTHGDGRANSFGLTSFIFGLGAMVALIAFLIAISGTSSFILGLVFLMPLLGIIAIVFGIKGLRRHSRDRGLAVAGLIMGLVPALVFSLMVFLLLAFAGI